MAKAKSAKKRPGFTLIELMVVVAIIVGMVIAVPALISWFKQQGVSLAVDQLRADLQLARMMAINQKQTCTVRFNVPDPNQYTNGLSSHTTRLSAYRGGVRFLDHGPDGRTMTPEIAFNRQGMSTSAPPKDVYMADQEKRTIFRVRVMLPGGISVCRWSKDRWR